MLATNINIDSLITILQKIKSYNVKLIDLEISKDEHNDILNKLTVYPIKTVDGRREIQDIPDNEQSSIEIMEPDISTDNDDIYDRLNDQLI